MTSAEASQAKPKGLLIHDDGQWNERIEMLVQYPAVDVDAAGAAEHATQMESSIA